MERMASSSNFRFIDGEQEAKCPYCAEWVKVEAKICKHCGRDIEIPLAEALAAEVAQQQAAAEAVRLAAEAEIEAARLSAEAHAQREAASADRRRLAEEQIKNEKNRASMARGQARRRFLRKRSTLIGAALLVVLVTVAVVAVVEQGIAQTAAQKALQLSTARLAARRALSTVTSYEHPTWTDVAAAEAHLQRDSATLRTLAKGSDIKSINKAIGDIDAEEKQISTPAQERQRQAEAAAAAAAKAATQAAAAQQAAALAAEKKANYAAAESILARANVCAYAGNGYPPNLTFAFDGANGTVTDWKFSNAQGQPQFAIAFSEGQDAGGAYWQTSQIDLTQNDSFNNVDWTCAPEKFYKSQWGNG
jgi:hypothetical protein